MITIKLAKKKKKKEKEREKIVQNFFILSIIIKLIIEEVRIWDRIIYPDNTDTVAPLHQPTNKPALRSNG